MSHGQPSGWRGWVLSAVERYQQIKDLSDRFAANARQLGIRTGDRVGMLLPNSPQFLIAYYGLLKAGAVIVPLNPLSAERELLFHFSDSGAETAITLPLFAHKVASLLGKTPPDSHVWVLGGDRDPDKGAGLAAIASGTFASRSYGV